MTAYETAADWAADLTGISPIVKLVALLIAFDTDKGRAGATSAHLGKRAGLTNAALTRALNELSDAGHITIAADEQDDLVYAVRWQA